MSDLVTFNSVSGFDCIEYILDENSKTVAIYGDSYGREGYCYYNDPEARNAWCFNDVITERYNVVNFAKHGSNFMYSYQCFLETNSKYDRTVFVVTEPHRHKVKIRGKYYFLPSASVTDYPNIWKQWIYDVTRDDGSASEEFLYKLADSLAVHSVYTMEDMLYSAGVHCLVESLPNKRSDIIVVYGFKNIFTSPDVLSLFEVTKMEENALDIKGGTHDEIRHAHMTNENNLVFAKHIRRLLDEQRSDITLNDFVRPDPKDKEKYFIKKV